MGAAFADATQDANPDGYMEIFFGPFKRNVRIPDHTAFFLLKPKHPFRVAVAAVVQHPVFESFILISIIITSVTLLIERPEWTVQANSCPNPPAYLDCLGLPPGQTTQVNCPRHVDDPLFGKVWGVCGSDDEPDCCHVAGIVTTFQRMDIFFTIVFLVELLLKVVADGGVLHPRAYMRNAWNWLDSIIVVISMISSISTLSGLSKSENLKSLKALRTIRALRPLRVIKRNAGMRVAVVCLLSSIPAMMNVVIVVVLWFSMYAMLGVQLFGGMMYRCYDVSNMLYYGASESPQGALYSPTLPLGGAGSVPTIIECVSAGNQGGTAVWEDKPYTFNNYFRALLTLFEMSTTEGWMDVMAATVDITKAGVTPIPNLSPWIGVLFCAAHIVIGAFVLLNLIVGSVINNYNRIKSQNDGIAPFMTPEQQEWKETQRIIWNLKPRIRQVGPKNKLRNLCFRVSQHKYFELLITAVIAVNVGTLMTRTYNESDCYRTAIFWCNVAFTIIFCLEAAVKLLGLGVRWYLIDYWNLFDFLVVTLSLLTIGLDISNQDYWCGPDKVTTIVNFPGLQTLRVFRVARVFRLIRRLKGLRQMIETLIVSLPSLANIAALLALFIMIFSVLGLTFFYNVNPDQDPYGRMDASHANYASIDNALWTLHRQTTGEAWNSIMYYCSQNDVYLACAKAYGGFLGDGCGGKATGIMFHVAWQLFGTYVMMQLFTAVILENFHELARGDQFVVPLAKLNEFVDTWTLLDPDAEQEIDVELLPQLVQNLSPPLGVKKQQVQRTQLMQVIKDLAIPIRHGRVTYHETFMACVKRVLDQDVGDDDGTVIKTDRHDIKDLEFSRAQSHTQHGHNTTFRGRRMMANEDFAARSVQHAYREWREKRLQVMKAVNRTTDIPLNAPEVKNHLVGR
mmetsp:Transcript_14436/g.35315  ORF Transcript_14436/g.35315 Transcript_14436/m.35315 type:complete len:906 (-) Transcript_14436:124-2841(-)